ncbi:zinc knuckle CX2CX4HX4C containing protein, partial [Tanacetum coccineum]
MEKPNEDLNVSRKLHASLIKNVDGKIIGKDGKPLKSAMRKPTGPNPKIGSKPVEPSLNKSVLNPYHEEFVPGLTTRLLLFQFSTRDGMEQVLENGPWLIRMVPIMLNIWTPNTVLKKDTITSVPVWVKLHNVPIAAFTEGKNAYVRVLIEVSSLSPLLDSVVVVVPFLDDTDYSFETVDVEYEWKPPRCDTCNIFDHVDSDCPKRIKVVVDADTSNDDGFTKVSRKRGKGKQTDKNWQVLGIKLTKPKSNLQYRPVVSAKPNSAAGESSKTHANTSDLNVDPKKGKDLDLRNSYEALDNDDNEFWTNA